MSDKKFRVRYIEEPEVALGVEADKPAGNRFPAGEGDLHRDRPAPAEIEIVDGRLHAAHFHRLVSIGERVQCADSHFRHGRDGGRYPRDACRNGFQSGIGCPGSVRNVQAEPDNEQLFGGLLDQQTAEFLAAGHEVVRPAKARRWNAQILEHADEVDSDHQRESGPLLEAAIRREDRGNPEAASVGNKNPSEPPAAAGLSVRTHGAPSREIAGEVVGRSGRAALEERPSSLSDTAGHRHVRRVFVHRP